MPEPRNPVTIIRGQAECDSLCRRLLGAEVVGLDVETTLCRPPDLCTVQLAVPGENYIIDALTLESLDGIAELLGSPDVVKVIHFAGFERGVFRGYGIEIENVFDTCARSRKLRSKADGGHSLLAVCRRELGIELDKRWQTSDWTRRPLLPEQIAYAALDAEVLLSLHEIFTR